MCPFPQKANDTQDYKNELQRYLKYVSKNCSCDELTKWLSRYTCELKPAKQPYSTASNIISKAGSLLSYLGGVTTSSQKGKTGFESDIRDRHKQITEVTHNLKTQVQD